MKAASRNEEGLQKKAEGVLETSHEDLLLQERVICSVSLKRIVAKQLASSCKNGGEERVK